MIYFYLLFIYFYLLFIKIIKGPSNRWFFVSQINILLSRTQLSVSERIPYSLFKAKRKKDVISPPWMLLFTRWLCPVRAPILILLVITLFLLSSLHIPLKFCSPTLSPHSTNIHLAPVIWKMPGATHAPPIALSPFSPFLLLFPPFFLSSLELLCHLSLVALPSNSRPDCLPPLGLLQLC